MNKIIKLSVAIVAISLTACASSLQRAWNITKRIQSQSDIESAATYLEPEFKKMCQKRSGNRLTWDEFQACYHLVRTITISHFLAKRYSEAIPYLDISEKYIFWMKNLDEGLPPNAKRSDSFTCDYTLSISDDLYDAGINVYQARFLALDAVSAPEAKNFLVKSYLCNNKSGIKDTSEYSYLDLDYPHRYSITPENFSRFNSRENFYSDLNRYFGDKGVKEGRFFMEEILDIIARESERIHGTTAKAKEATLYKNAISYAYKTKITTEYIDFLEYKLQEKVSESGY